MGFWGDEGLAVQQYKEMNRGDFDGHWFVPSAPLPQYTKFSHRPVAEVPGMRDVAKPFVGQAIVDHHLHRQLVADRLQDLGYPQTAAAIRDELPKSDRTRKGNFGEVIASEHLVQRYGYLMPVFKLRFRDHPNLPMRGEDVIAFVRDAHGSITKVCVGEAKVIVAFAHQTVEKAHERLAYTYHPHPETLHLIVSILHERGDHAFARDVDRLRDRLASGVVAQENWIFIITDDAPPDPFVRLESMPQVVSSLNCVNLRLSDLSVLVTDLFTNPAIEVP